MRDIGVRFIVFDHTNTVHVDNGQIDRRIRKWYDWMDKQPEEKRLLLTIAAGGELNQHSNRDGWKEASSFLWENYASRPSHARLHGKPLLCWYIEKDVWDDWVDDRWTIRRTYHFFRTPDQGKHEGWGWGSNPEPPPNAECMCVMPGWHRGDDKGGGVPRLAGQHYTKGWLAILKARPRYILIGSWNEWGELTAIENSLGWEDRRGQSCPDYYTKMTKGYLAAAEGLLLDDCYYQVEGEPSIRKWTGSSWRPQAQAPSRHPVIVLPREWKPRQ